ncbi:MAG: hypothetical protein R2831_11450 [Chitinophagaceae bacterium]
MLTTIQKEGISEKIQKCSNAELLLFINRLLEKDGVKMESSNIFSIDNKARIQKVHQPEEENYDHLTVDEFMDLMRKEAREQDGIVSSPKNSTF